MEYADPGVGYPNKILSIASFTLFNNPFNSSPSYIGKSSEIILCEIIGIEKLCA
ncbi:MAG: hypothetical protein ACM3SR_09200 [Ignavibacteriales bacterium]